MYAAYTDAVLEIDCLLTPNCPAMRLDLQQELKRLRFSRKNSPAFQDSFVLILNTGPATNLRLA